MWSAMDKMRRSQLSNDLVITADYCCFRLANKFDCLGVIMPAVPGINSNASKIGCFLAHIIRLLMISCLFPYMVICDIYRVFDKLCSTSCASLHLNKNNTQTPSAISQAEKSCRNSGYIRIAISNRRKSRPMDHHFSTLALGLGSLPFPQPHTPQSTP